MPIDLTNPVLLVENEPLIAMDVEAMLRSAGFLHVDHVVSCQEALQRLENYRPTVAILDLIVSDGNTAVVAERLRETQTAFIVYSGLSQAEVGDAAAFDRAAWLAKPCTPSELIDALENALGRSLG